MRPRSETMDEAIDRVAATLTSVRDDEEFVSRLGAHLDAPSPRTRGLWLIAASVTTAVILGVVVSFDQNPPQRIPINTSAATSAPAPAVPASDLIEPPVAAEQHVVRVRSELAHVSPGAMLQIPALGGPDSLNVEALLFESLTIEPVTEPGRLEVPSLEVRNIEAAADQKEQ